MTSHLDKFKEYLKLKELKFTPERKIILEEVFVIHTHFDSEILYKKIYKRTKKISRATIYRTIPILIASELIREVLQQNGRTYYEHTFGHGHHDHLLCVKCGRVIEFYNKSIEKLQDQICKKYGFSPTDHKLGIRGYCRKCSPR